MSAHEAGASVAMIETAPKEARGGNSAFTGAAFHFTYSNVDDLLQLAPDIADLDLATIDFGSYTEGQYFDDMGRLTEYRCDPNLTEVLVGNSFDAGLGLRKHGVRFQLALGRQAFKVGENSSSGAGWRATSWAANSTSSQRCTNDSSVSAFRCCTTPPPPRCCVATRASMACGCCTSSGSTICVPARWCWPAADSNRMPRCVHAISAELGPREGALHQIQHRHRPSHGDRHSRRGRRPLVGRACRAPPYGDVTFGAMPITTVASGPRKLPTSGRSNQPATARDDHTARFRTPW